MAQPTQQAQVVSVRSLSPAVRELVLSPLARKISFRPGQWISRQLPVGERPPLIKAYSMAEPEASSGYLVLAFDHVPKGLGAEPADPSISDTSDKLFLIRATLPERRAMPLVAFFDKILVHGGNLDDEVHSPVRHALAAEP